MVFVDIATLKVRREFRPETDDGRFDVRRDCGMGCSCAASVWIRDGKPSTELAEMKTLCFNDQKRQGISEIKGSGRAIKEGPDEWIYEVEANLVEARPDAPTCGNRLESEEEWRLFLEGCTEDEAWKAIDQVEELARSFAHKHPGTARRLKRFWEEGAAIYERRFGVPWAPF